MGLVSESTSELQNSC